MLIRSSLASDMTGVLGCLGGSGGSGGSADGFDPEDGFSSCSGLASFSVLLPCREVVLIRSMGSSSVVSSSSVWYSLLSSDELSGGRMVLVLLSVMLRCRVEPSISSIACSWDFFSWLGRFLVHTSQFFGNGQGNGQMVEFVFA